MQDSVFLVLVIELCAFDIFITFSYLYFILISVSVILVLQLIIFQLGYLPRWHFTFLI